MTTMAVLPVPQWCTDHINQGIYAVRDLACGIIGVTLTTSRTTNRTKVTRLDECADMTGRQAISHRYGVDVEPQLPQRLRSSGCAISEPVVDPENDLLRADWPQLRSCWSALRRQRGDHHEPFP